MLFVFTVVRNTRMITMNKTYTELMEIDSFRKRYRYLKIGGKVGEETFGHGRYLNQVLYGSSEWKNLRSRVIVRDNGRDLSHTDYPIVGRIIVHHINPITKDDILRRDPKVFDMENLICVSHMTHEAIHYGDIELLPKDYVPRSPNDTCPWRVRDG